MDQPKKPKQPIKPKQPKQPEILHTLMIQGLNGMKLKQESMTNKKNKIPDMEKRRSEIMNGYNGQSFNQKQQKEDKKISVMPEMAWINEIYKMPQNLPITYMMEGQNGMRSNQETKETKIIERSGFEIGYNDQQFNQKQMKEYKDQMQIVQNAIMKKKIEKKTPNQQKNKK